MRKIENKNILKRNFYKRSIAFICIVLGAFIIELLFNWQAIRHGYDPIDLTKNMKIIEEDGNEKYVATYENTDCLYINKINIKASFQKADGYAIQLEEINGFDKKSDTYYEDIINPYFSEFSTVINKKVDYLKITIPKPEDAQVYEIKVTNNIEINKYRVLFCLVVLCLLYLAFFEIKFTGHIERYSAVAILLYGIVLIFGGQVGCNSWDEAFHFEKAYSIASGKNVEWTEAASDIANKSVPSSNTKLEYAELRNYINNKGNEVLYTENKDDIGLKYSSFAYIPMAIFIKIGLLLNLSFVKIFMLGKLGNLLFYTAFMYFAIREAKYKKIFLAFIAMLPTCVFLASSYTYDSVVFSSVTLGCVLWCNEFFSEKKVYNTGKIIFAILCFSVGCLSKAVYIPLILLIMLLPQLKAVKKRQAIIWGIGILIIFGLVMITFVLPVISNTVSGNLAYGGDSRGGDTGTARQLISMLSHPIESIKLMISSVFKFDNFRNLGSYEKDNYFFGNLMFLNLAQFGVLKDKWAALLVVMFVLLLLYESEGENQKLSYKRNMRIMVILIGTITVFLIWLALYLDFTPVGETYIAGVQARYYLPLVYLGAIAFMNKKIKFHANYYLVAKSMIVGTNIFWIAAVSDMVLKNRLL